MSSPWCDALAAGCLTNPSRLHHGRFRISCRGDAAASNFLPDAIPVATQ